MTAPVFMCMLCRVTFATREASCHYLHTLPVEDVVRGAGGKVVDCAEVATQTFRAAKPSVP